MVFTVESRGTMPPGEMDGACAWLAWATFTSAAVIDRRPEPGRAIANRTPFVTRVANGGFLELARGCLASRTLATRSAMMSRMPLPIIAADALVTIAMAEPVTAA